MKGDQGNRAEVGKLDRHRGGEKLRIYRTPGTDRVTWPSTAWTPAGDGVSSQDGNRGKTGRLVSWVGGRGKRLWIVLAILH